MFCWQLLFWNLCRRTNNAFLVSSVWPPRWRWRTCLALALTRVTRAPRPRHGTRFTSRSALLLHHANQSYAIPGGLVRVKSRYRDAGPG